MIFSLLPTPALFISTCLAIVWWIFRTGYRLKN
jgi:hypothetical protein